MTETINVAFCPHCSNTAPQRLIHVQPYRSYGYNLDGSKTDDDILACAYFVAECLTCREILLYLAEGDIPPDGSFVDAGLHWPAPGLLDESVPDSVRRCYAEAALIKNLAPNGFAGQIRRALEALCQDRTATGRTLHDRLRWLVEKGEIPPVLAEMTDILRLIGNIGVHSSDVQVQHGHVGPIDEFFRAIIEYVYVAPKKISKLRDSLEGKRTILGDA